MHNWPNYFEHLGAVIIFMVAAGFVLDKLFKSTARKADD